MGGWVSGWSEWAGWTARRQISSSRVTTNTMGASACDKSGVHSGKAVTLLRLRMPTAPCRMYVFVEGRAGVTPTHTSRCC